MALPRSSCFLPSLADDESTSACAWNRKRQGWQASAHTALMQIWVPTYSYYVLKMSWYVAQADFYHWILSEITGLYSPAPPRLGVSALDMFSAYAHWDNFIDKHFVKEAVPEKVQ